MFNLFIDQDSTNTLLIEPRNTYLENSNLTIRDWTNKVDTKIIKIERSSDIINKIIDFKYDYDEDNFSKLYKDKYNPREYGEYFKTNLRSLDKYEINLIFAPAIHGPIIKYSEYRAVRSNFSIEVPKIYIKSSDPNSNEVEVKEFKPRILIYNGLVSTNKDDTFRLITNLGDPYIWTNQFPCVSHFNAPYGNETIDIMFGESKSYLADVDAPVTTNNLFNSFYKTMIDEYTSSDTKLVTMNIFLTPKDIEHLRFYDRIFVNGIYYRLNKIIDYIPNNFCKVELISINEFLNSNIYTESNYNIIEERYSNISNSIYRIIDGGTNNVSNMNQGVLIDIIDNKTSPISTDPAILDTTFIGRTTGSDTHITVVDGNDCPPFLSETNLTDMLYGGIKKLNR